MDTTLYEGSHYWYIGRLCISLYTLAGLWCSLGVHVSIVPLGLNVHIGWFILSLCTKEQGLEMQEAEYANAEV